MKAYLSRAITDLAEKSQSYAVYPLTEKKLRFGRDQNITKVDVLEY